MIRVVTPGPLATVQDLGRPGWGMLGVARAGAADRAAHRLANRLVGNDESAATIEITLGGFEAYLERPAVVAATGAPCPISVSDGPALGHHVALALPAGATVRLGPATSGLRAYLAVRGGVVATQHLGSVSTDTLGQLGPPPLRAGDRLEVGPDPGVTIVSGPAPRRDPSWHDPGAPVEVALHAGPRLDRIDPDVLVASPCAVGHEVSRVGVRLDPERPVVARGPSLASEGIVPGAVQVPPDGRPIVFLVDHPVTGGYPVVAVVDPGHLDRVAQLRPGDAVRFSWHR